MGAVVFPKPTPADLLVLALIVLLGLVHVEPALGLLLSMMLVAAAAALLGATTAFEIELALAHTRISLYLYLATIVIAGFIAKRAGAHASLVLNAYLCAAMVAALVGSVGYFDLLPGAREMMTRYGRATGLFKDPNVFEPFLVPAMLYVMSRLIAGSIRRALLWLAALPVLGLGIAVELFTRSLALRRRWLSALCRPALCNRADRPNAPQALGFGGAGGVGWVSARARHFAVAWGSRPVCRARGFDPGL